MGLFGFGKKKEKMSETDKVFKDFGQQTNDIKAPATRKETKVATENIRIAQIKKEQLLDGLSALRKKMYSRPEFDGYINKLEDSIHKLRGMEDVANKAALSSVDNFILGSLNEAINYCNRGNYIAMGACIDIVESLIDDRFMAGDYYTDPEFCKFRLRRNQLYVEQQNQQSEYDKLEARMAQLKADAQNPNLRVSKESIVREASRIKAEGQRIKQLLDKLESNIQLLDKSIYEIKSHSITHATDNVFDMTNEIDKIIGLKRENEMDDATTDKLNEKLDQSHRKVSSNALNVNDGVITESTPIELTDDLFKM